MVSICNAQHCTWQSFSPYERENNSISQGWKLSDLIFPLHLRPSLNVVSPVHPVLWCKSDAYLARPALLEWKGKYLHYAFRLECAPHCIIPLTQVLKHNTVSALIDLYCSSTHTKALTSHMCANVIPIFNTLYFMLLDVFFPCVCSLYFTNSFMYQSMVNASGSIRCNDWALSLFELPLIWLHWIARCNFLPPHCIIDVALFCFQGE